MIKNAHTATYTGRYWLKNIKASFSFACIELTESNLICRYRLFDLLILNIDLSDINEVKPIRNKPGLISIKFNRAIFGKLSKFALSGQPAGSKNQVILNVKNGIIWLEKLDIVLNNKS